MTMFLVISYNVTLQLYRKHVDDYFENRKCPNERFVSIINQSCERKLLNIECVKENMSQGSVRLMSVIIDQ